ncbi:MAG TPA: LCP family protein [Feifaniaceae bacterium]|nr:LCP family protein [Feifaniaceae bacterium]
MNTSNARRPSRYFILFLCLAFALFSGPGIIEQPAPQTAEAEPETVDAAAQSADSGRLLGEDTINIVLMGIDSNEEREERGRGYRSDTIAILVIDPDIPSCTVLSVPRDTRAFVRRLDDNGRVQSTQYNKINSAFNFGGGPEEYGHENLIYSLEKLLFNGLSGDFHLNYYASIDMDGIAKFADAVGGVPVTLSYDMPGFGKKGDTVLLKGEQAQSFVRMRHGITGGSDIARVKRQQTFIRAFASRVKSMNPIQTVPRLWTALNSYVHTNVGIGQMLVLAEVLSDLNLDGVEFVTLPGRCKTIERRSYYVTDADKVRALALSLWGESNGK